MKEPFDGYSIESTSRQIKPQCQKHSLLFQQPTHIKPDTKLSRSNNREAFVRKSPAITRINITSNALTKQHKSSALNKTFPTIWGSKSSSSRSGSCEEENFFNKNPSDVINKRSNTVEENVLPQCAY